MAGGCSLSATMGGVVSGSSFSAQGSAVQRAVPLPYLRPFWQSLQAGFSPGGAAGSFENLACQRGQGLHD